jgi:hypothetical protein
MPEVLVLVLILEAMILVALMPVVLMQKMRRGIRHLIGVRRIGCRRCCYLNFRQSSADTSSVCNPFLNSNNVNCTGLLNVKAP